jgi:hypothetical protein
MLLPNHTLWWYSFQFTVIRSRLYYCIVWSTDRLPVSPYIFLHLSRSLTVARVHSKTLHPCSSNQCDTARLESKLSSIQIMHISSHEIVHSFLYDTQRPSYQNPQRRHVAVRLRNEERPSVFFWTLPVLQTSRSPSFPTLLTIVEIIHF